MKRRIVPIMLSWLTLSALFGQQLSPSEKEEKPRVFVGATSYTMFHPHGDESIATSKVFAGNCPEVRTTMDQQMADYSITFRIVNGLYRDFVTTYRNGDLVTNMSNKDSKKARISGQIKKACVQVLADWAKRTQSPPPHTEK